MTSLRARLFFILVAGTFLVWMFAVGWIYVGTKHEVESVLDSRLQEAARMVASLAPGSMHASAGDPASAAVPIVAGYERQLSCQIWSLDGRLVARSSGAPSTRLSDTHSGFSERLIEGDIWRVFTIQDPEKGIRVLVGDRMRLRERLVSDLIMGLLAPTVLILPLLGLLIWMSLGHGLQPLRLLAQELLHRDADDLRPIAPGKAPTEIRPVVTSLNGLFTKVEAARQHEREITAFAAHELRTPLAGLRTQAQIARVAADPAVRMAALDQVLNAVDRATRLVRQLLTIAKLDAHDDRIRVAPVNIGDVLAEAIDALPSSDSRVRVSIHGDLENAIVSCNADLLTLALRNLHENAIHHMRSGGVVSWRIETTADDMLVIIEDEGPGIPDDELPMVANRFFRGRFKTAFGSGLGLAIVDLALRANGAGLRLTNRKPGSGLRAEIVWPLHRCINLSSTERELEKMPASARLSLGVS